MKMLKSLTFVTLAFCGQTMLAVSPRYFAERNTKIQQLHNKKATTVAEAKAQHAELQKIMNELTAVPRTQQATAAPSMKKATAVMRAKQTRMKVLETEQAFKKATQNEAQTLNKLEETSKKVIAEINANPSLSRQQKSNLEKKVTDLVVAATSDVSGNLDKAAANTSNPTTKAIIDAGSAASTTGSAAKAAAVIAANAADKVEQPEKLQDAIENLTSTKANPAEAAATLQELSKTTDDAAASATLQVAAETALKGSADTVIKDAITAGQADPNPTVQEATAQAATSGIDAFQAGKDLLFAAGNLITGGALTNFTQAAQNEQVKADETNVKQGEAEAASATAVTAEVVATETISAPTSPVPAGVDADAWIKEANKMQFIPGINDASDVDEVNGWAGEFAALNTKYNVTGIDDLKANTTAQTTYETIQDLMQKKRAALEAPVVPPAKPPRRPKTPKEKAPISEESEFGPESEMAPLTSEKVTEAFAGFKATKEAPTKEATEEMTSWNQNANQKKAIIESYLGEIAKLQAPIYVYSPNYVPSFLKTIQADPEKVERALNNQIRIGHEIQKIAKGALMGYKEAQDNEAGDNKVRDNKQLMDTLEIYLKATQASLKANNFYEQVQGLQYTNPELYAQYTKEVTRLENEEKERTKKVVPTSDKSAIVTREIKIEGVE